MRASAILLTFATATTSLPLLGLEKVTEGLGLDKVVHEVGQFGGGGGLINVSPNVSPKIGLSNDGSCTGVGVSACDPINVGGTQNSNNDSKQKAPNTTPAPSGQSGSGSGGGLINLSPVISPDVDVSNDNSCTGIGISVCDPINVDGTQNSHNS
ncbi:hypothetical protein PG993_006111 [Apiospora rasikravindrae]|uniref:Uncharacterized protein n=1 Tax=Apiospora rasikravindrae TaxID=990691 RepID=A0ABR1TAP2_9PEZI